MANAQAARAEQVHHRIDRLAVGEVDLPKLPAQSGRISFLSNFGLGECLSRSEADHEHTALAGQCGNVSFANQLARLQDSDPIADQLDLAEQMGIDEYRLALF